MTGDMFGAANSTCGDPRRFRRTSTVIVTLRRVKCPQGRDGRRTSSMMTKPIISSRKSHTSHKRSLVATAARAAGPRAPGRAGRAAGARSCHIAGLVFAPVRPGIVAACMVKTAGQRRGPGYRPTALDRPIRNGQKEYFADSREGLRRAPGASKLSMHQDRTAPETCPWLR